MENKKTLFVIKTDHAIDIITNSSSELFVLQGQTSEIVKEMVLSAHPNYTAEYREPVSVHECDVDDLETYMSNELGSFYAANAQVLEGFTREEMYELDGCYAWLKRDFVKNNHVKIRDLMDPKKNTYLLFSLEENPEWELQEALMGIGTRYHLG